MLRSSDGNLTVESVKNKSSVIIPASDVSVVNAPADQKEFDQLVKSINGCPTDKHLCLMFFRHTKGDVLKAFSNLNRVENLEYLDSVHITYQKSSRRTGSFMHLAEPAFIFYKGPTPNVDNTDWFRGTGSNNASNHWDMSPYQEDDFKEDAEFSVFPKFSWDLGLLLMTLANPLSHKKIVWTLPWDTNLIDFITSYNIKMHIVASTDTEAMEAIHAYETAIVKKEKK